MAYLNSKKLVAALRRKREAEGLSIRALSIKIGISFSALARIERGEGEPDNNSAIRILNWLGDYAHQHGLSYQETALVHFRAAKNVSSKTMHCLLQAADAIKKIPYNTESPRNETNDSDQQPAPTNSLSKSEMEMMAANLRAELNVREADFLDALSIRVSGVDLLIPTAVKGLSRQCLSHLIGPGRYEWSAMSVPLSNNHTRWAVLRNDKHQIERQRVTYLEECWHILLGHKLTRIAKLADSYGRTYDSDEEHDAFYLAAATLVPKSAIVEAVASKLPVKAIAEKYGVSSDLVEYRIKRLGLWRMHKGISVKLGDSE